MPTAWLVGKKLSDITTHGKYLFFHFKDGIVQVHLGLFGSVIINEQKTVNRKFYLAFANGEINCYIVNAKKIDSIVLNSLNNAHAGFGFDTNQVTIISKNGNQEVVPLKSKTEVAKEIVVFISKEINA